MLFLEEQMAPGKKRKNARKRNFGQNSQSQDQNKKQHTSLPAEWSYVPPPESIPPPEQTRSAIGAHDLSFQMQQLLQSQEKLTNAVKNLSKGQSRTEQKLQAMQQKMQVNIPNGTKQLVLNNIQNNIQNNRPNIQNLSHENLQGQLRELIHQMRNQVSIDLHCSACHERVHETIFYFENDVENILLDFFNNRNHKHKHEHKINNI